MRERFTWARKTKGQGLAPHGEKGDGFTTDSRPRKVYVDTGEPGEPIRGHGRARGAQENTREPRRSTKRHQEAPRGTKRHQGAPRNTKRHQEAPRGTKKHQEAPRSTKRHQGAPKPSKRVPGPDLTKAGRYKTELALREAFLVGRFGLETAGAPGRPARPGRAQETT